MRAPTARLRQRYGIADHPFRVAHIDELERIEVAGVLWRPLRRLLGTRAFGVGAFTADQSGDELIERHDETSVGAGRHEELLDTGLNPIRDDPEFPR